MTRFGVTTVALLLIGAVIAAVALISGGTEKTAPAAVADAATKKLTTAQLIGQRITTGYVGTTPPRSVLRAVRSGRIGGVVLFTNNMPTPAVARRAINKLRAWAEAGGMPPPFVMTDQEGGIVQRLPSIPPTRTPASMGRNSDPARTGMNQGLATGRALKKYGFNVNLAPVVDVPKVRNSFLGNRAYSSSAQVTANATCAFAEGNEKGGVAATFKHFPGLGRAGADTDFNDVDIDASRALIDADNEPYRQCPATPTFVMMSSSRYSKLGFDRPASLERGAYTMLAETGFRGLTITDALDTPQFGPGANTSRTALQAGVDVLLWGQAYGRAMSARSRLLRDVKSGRVTRAQLEPGVERIVALKQKLSDK
ncbi:MAG: glycoside hydrolase family 3 protein [Solirubrobacterales bacterium]|nr:glycoside hydrolase family 3 protein [Solirubrobacterales bacterium]